MTSTTIPTTIHRLENETTDHNRSRSLWQVTVTATAGAAVATELFTLAARAVDVPMRAADPGAAAAQAIPVGGVAMAVLMHGVIGLVFAVVLARWAKAPAKVFAAVTATYSALSLLGPMFAPHTDLATKNVLLVAHVVAAVIIIPPVTARLGSTRD